MKIKFFKIASIIIGITVASLLFVLPLTAATLSSDNEPTEEISESFDNDDIEEEFEGEYEDEDEPEEESGIEDDEDETLPGGGHEDSDGVDVEHEFEGVE